MGSASVSAAYEQSVGLRKQRLTLVIKILREHAELRTIGIRVDSHSLILPRGEDASQGNLTMAYPQAGRSASGRWD